MQLKYKYFILKTMQNMATVKKKMLKKVLL